MFSTSGDFMTSEISGNLQIIFAYVSEAVSYIEYLQYNFIRRSLN